MATLDADAARGNERADGAEKKIMDLEEELKVAIFESFLLIWLFLQFEDLTKDPFDLIGCHFNVF